MVVSLYRSSHNCNRLLRRYWLVLLGILELISTS